MSLLYNHGHISLTFYVKEHVEDLITLLVVVITNIHKRSPVLRSETWEGIFTELLYTPVRTTWKYDVFGSLWTLLGGPFRGRRMVGEVSSVRTIIVEVSVPTTLRTSSS